MICTNCGANNPDGMKFCSNCGTPIQAAASPATPESAAPTTDPAYNINQPTQVQPPAQQPLNGQPAQPPMGAPNAQYQQQPYGGQPQQGFQQQPYGAQPAPQYQQPYGAPNPEPKKKPPIVPIVIAVVAVLIIAGVIIAGVMTNWFGLAPATSGSSSSSASSSASSESSSSSDPTAAWVGTYKVTGGSALTGSADGKQKLYLAEDGKAALDIQGSVTMGSWKADDGETGTLTMNNGDFDIELDGDEITVTNTKKQTLVFTRTASNVDGMPSASSTSSSSSASSGKSSSSSSASSSASSTSSSSPFVGKWKLTSMTSNGKTLSEKEIDSTGVTITLDIKSDGSFIYGTSGQTMNGTWKANSDKQVTLTVSGSPLVFDLKDSKTLVTTDQGTSMTFTKQ